MTNAVVIAREHLKSGLVGVSRRCLTFVALVATGLDLFAAEPAYDVLVVSGESDGAFGGGNRSMDGFLVALGRTRDARALEPLLARLEKVTVDQPVMALRGPTLALEALASPRAAPALAKILKKDGFHGFAVSDFRSLPPLGGYGLSSETDNCIRELALARTLWACGDHDGLPTLRFTAFHRFRTPAISSRSARSAAHRARPPIG